MSKSTSWTATRRATFIDILRNTGNVSAAARAVGIPRQRAYEERRRNPQFREEWLSAVEEAVDDLESELRRRAVEGTERPVYYGGSQCGSIRSYSDNLGMFLLKGRRHQVFGPSANKEDPEKDNAPASTNTAREILTRKLSSIQAAIREES